ncbi:putative interleukin-1 receptor accessory protein-like [Homarus americanus]|uniref:Soluble interferon alpha/beta receptor OPG204 n=1 Tax=Homarus americanus TaxID=6706 RepID=A0A8J5MRP6_HOMAM|nr:putative interleukin-1 receptor accessory protein-like [Homarus americanus]
MRHSVHLALFMTTLNLALVYMTKHICRYNCIDLPQEELSSHVSQGIISNRAHCIHCCPHSLLGFPVDQYHNHSFNISWKFNGKEFLPKRNGNSFKALLDNMTLKSKHVMVGDEGVYTCTVKDTNGTSVTRNISLCVNANEDTVGNQFSSNVSKGASVLPGESVTFTCSGYTGSISCHLPQEHNITWTKKALDGSWVPVGLLRHVHTSQHEDEDEIMMNHLKISKVEEDHYGLYRCTFTNHNGHFMVNGTLLKGVVGKKLVIGQYKAVVLVVTILTVFLVVVCCVCPRSRLVIALYCRGKSAPFPPGTSSGTAASLLALLSTLVWGSSAVKKISERLL